MTSSHICTSRRPRSPVTPLLVAAATTMLAVVLTLLSSGPAVAQSLPQTCADEPVDADYEDRGEIASVHLDAVDCATQLGIAQGLGTDQGEVFLPHADVRRDQMASFVARTLTEAGVELPAGGDHGFTDVADDATHADAIAQLAAADIVNGVTADSYDPSSPVSRDQMASYLIRALAYQADVEVQDLQDGDTPFTDIDPDGTHGPNIAGLYNLGITAGTTADTYTPGGNVSREAMASFVVRGSDAMQSRQTVADRDAGALSHTVFTFLSESGRCFQVKAGTVWVAGCEPATDETLQVRTVTVDDNFTVTTGLVTDAVARVAVEAEGSSTDLDLTETRSAGLRAWASPILATDVDAIVAYDDTDTEIARMTPDDASGSAFPADTSRSQDGARG